MVLPAADTLIITNATVTRTASEDIQLEVSLAENRILGAAGLGLYSTHYNATIIGNPQVDPSTHTDLPPNQIQFFELFIEAGYTVSVDTATGYWLFSWSSEGANTLVQIYSFRTSFDPTGVVTQTKTVIDNFFASLRPVVHSTVTFNNDIDETAFGGTTSTVYEFTIVTDQQEPGDLSSGLKTALIAQGLGYTTNNCNVYRLAI